MTLEEAAAELRQAEKEYDAIDKEVAVLEIEGSRARKRMHEAAHRVNQATQNVYALARGKEIE